MNRNNSSTDVNGTCAIPSKYLQYILPLQILISLIYILYMGSVCMQIKLDGRVKGFAEYSNLLQL
jgi:hypothetical protein